MIIVGLVPSGHVQPISAQDSQSQANSTLDLPSNGPTADDSGSSTESEAAIEHFGIAPATDQTDTEGHARVLDLSVNSGGATGGQAPETSDNQARAGYLRLYQKEMVERSTDENALVVLNTGAGKTHM